MMQIAKMIIVIVVFLFILICCPTACVAGGMTLAVLWTHMLSYFYFFFLLSVVLMKPAIFFFRGFSESMIFLLSSIKSNNISSWLLTLVSNCTTFIAKFSLFNAISIALCGTYMFPSWRRTCFSVSGLPIRCTKSLCQFTCICRLLDSPQGLKEPSL